MEADEAAYEAAIQKAVQASRAARKQYASVLGRVQEAMVNGKSVWPIIRDFTREIGASSPQPVEVGDSNEGDRSDGIASPTANGGAKSGSGESGSPSEIVGQ
jgi:hypothetical protein